MFPVVYSHKFPYRLIERSNCNGPAVEVTITAGGESVSTIAAVDTGAEFTAFETEYANLLNLSLFDAPERRRVNTVASNGVELFIFPVTLQIAGAKWNTKVGFFAPTPSGSSGGKNLLGRNGFLEFVQAGFREKYQEFYLTLSP